MRIEILLAGLGLVSVAGAAVYWHTFRLEWNSRYKAYDLLFLTIIFGIVLTRVVAMVIDYTLFPRQISVRHLFNFADLNFFYWIVAFIPLIAYQFHSFNINFNPKWTKSVFAPIMLGYWTVFTLSGFQVARVFLLDMGRDLAIFPAGVMAVCSVSAVMLWWLNYRSKLARMGYTSLVIYTAFTSILISFNTFLSRGEISAYILGLVFTCGLALLPFVPYTTRRSRSNRV